MKQLLHLLWISLLTSISWANSELAIGKWQTIDDETGEPKSIIELKIENKKLTGKIIALYIDGQLASDAPYLCDKCKGKLHNQPIVGLTILNDLTWDRKAAKWQDGTILDPSNGKEYSAWLQVQEDQNSIEIRGFIGFSFAGRSQTWLRLAE